MIIRRIDIYEASEQSVKFIAYLPVDGFDEDRMSRPDKAYAAEISNWVEMSQKFDVPMSDFKDSFGVIPAAGQVLLVVNDDEDSKPKVYNITVLASPLITAMLDDFLLRAKPVGSA